RAQGNPKGFEESRADLRGVGIEIILGSGDIPLDVYGTYLHEAAAKQPALPGCGRPHSREALNPGQKRGILVCFQKTIHGENSHAVFVKPNIDDAQIVKRANKQTGSDQQNHTESDLNGDGNSIETCTLCRSPEDSSLQ